MQLQVMFLTALPAHAANFQPLAHMAACPAVARASLGIPDTLAIFVVALVVFGPKRLPEIGKQIGKLVFEFRRASNDFKLQIEEELRMAEQQDRQKVLDLQAASSQPATPVALSAQSTTSSVPSEALPDAGVEATQTTEPLPPDRRIGVVEQEATQLTSASFVSGNTEASSAVVEPPSSLPAKDATAPLTVQPPSTGTLVSALPPNHAARNVMTSLPSASAAPEMTESSTPAEQAAQDTTAHNG